MKHVIIKIKFAQNISYLYDRVFLILLVKINYEICM